jgi:hypothetical protein
MVNKLNCHAEHLYNNISEIGNTLIIISVYPHLRAGQRTKHCCIRKLLTTTGHFLCIAILIHYEIINPVQAVEKNIPVQESKEEDSTMPVWKFVIARVDKVHCKVFYNRHILGMLMF